MTLLEKAMTLKRDDKITLVYKDLMGEKYYKKAYFKENIGHNGYISKNGSWSLYNTGKFEEKPCFDMTVKLFRHKYYNTVLLEYSVIDIIEGWDINV